MIKIEHTDVYGFETAIRGMRNPKNSWDKSDSYARSSAEMNVESEWVIGENDLKLMKNLAKAGDDHGKFLRMITVTADITAPLYWYKEYDTYKVGTVANSTSTMHKVHAKPFEMDDFSHDHMDEETLKQMQHVIDYLEHLRGKYLETKDKQYWYDIIQFLPSSYNQMRTVQLNYQVLKSMYYARKDHKLDEWRLFCKWIEELPYFKEIVLEE